MFYYLFSSAMQVECITLSLLECYAEMPPCFKAVVERRCKINHFHPKSISQMKQILCCMYHLYKKRPAQPCAVLFPCMNLFDNTLSENRVGFTKRFFGRKYAQILRFINA